MNEIEKYMTINEASERWGVSIDRIKNKLSPSRTSENDINRWIERGLIKPYVKPNGKNKLWIISIYFMILHFGEEKQV